LQRLRIRFSRSAEIRYISHLDMMRAWVRALRRARVPVAMSEGFNRQPRVSLAAPLAVGVTSEAEVLDVWLSHDVDASEAVPAIQYQLPRGMAILGAAAVPLATASAQSKLVAASYRVLVGTGESCDGLQARINALLESPEIPRQRVRDGKVLHYDLRPLVEELSLWPAGDAGVHCLCMRLSARPGATGRPEEVALALGIEQILSVHRTGLYLEGDA
jgi:radical SAM-linked protein